MPGFRRALPILAAIALIAGVAGCGGSNDEDKIPSDLAATLLPPIESAQTALDSEQCAGVQDSAKTFAERVSAIPAGEIDQDVKDKLVEAGENLKRLSVDDCEETPTGPSGAADAQGSTASPGDDETGDPVAAATPPPTDPPEEPAAETKPEPKQPKPAQAPAPAEPAQAKIKPEKPKKPEKKHGKPGKEPKRNGPPGPAGNPNHPEPTGSGGIGAGGD